jgi:hypothetical protein
VIQSEIIRIADTCDLAKQTFTSKVVGLDVIDTGYASKVRLVQAHTSDGSGSQRNGRDHSPRVGEGGVPVARPVRINPCFGDLLLLVIVGT